VPTLQKRPPNCGTGYCSCVECVMEPAPVQEPVNGDKVKQLVSKCTHRDVDGNWYVDGVQLVHETCFALDAIKRKSATPPAPAPVQDEACNKPTDAMVEAAPMNMTNGLKTTKARPSAYVQCLSRP
jgi:hypothetical protein